ncbi:MAG TPA: hypothetical protein VKM55_01185 [Candidatus Lokiarchaeia archaeon]|nr:hypothetical protein [Candidatus Lokiarchaeia archaeon]
MLLKINIRFLNWFLVIQFIALTFILILIQALLLQSMGELSTHPFFISSGVIDPGTVVLIVLNGIAALLFFYDAKRYQAVRSGKKDPYLASLVFFSMIYQGISRSLEFQNPLYSSDYSVMSYIIKKYYFPLDIIGTVLFAIVVFEVFLRPRMAEERAAKINNLLFLLAILADVIGILVSFFPWFTPASAFIISSITVVVIVYSIIVVIYLFIIRIIVGLYKRKTDMKSPSALLTIMLMLVVFLAVHVFLLVSETGSFTGLSTDATIAFRIVKASLYCGLAVLYYFSFVKPSTMHS